MPGEAAGVNEGTETSPPAAAFSRSDGNLLKRKRPLGERPFSQSNYPSRLNRTGDNGRGSSDDGGPNVLAPSNNGLCLPNTLDHGRSSRDHQPPRRDGWLAPRERKIR